MTKKEYIEIIVKKIIESDDDVMLEFIYQLVNKSA